MKFGNNGWCSSVSRAHPSLLDHHYTKMALKTRLMKFKDVNKYILRDSGVIIYCKQAVFNDRPRQGNLITLFLFLINILNLYWLLWFSYFDRFIFHASRILYPSLSALSSDSRAPPSHSDIQLRHFKHIRTRLIKIKFDVRTLVMEKSQVQQRLRLQLTSHNYHYQDQVHLVKMHKIALPILDLVSSYVACNSFV